MERKIKTVIGIEIQNNSGGYFIENDEVQRHVAIEGIWEQQANET